MPALAWVAPLWHGVVLMRSAAAGVWPGPTAWLHLAALLIFIVGGLIVGASEKLAEIYAGPLIGSGIENWFPYVLAMLFLLVRPTGLFGERSIDRV